MNVPILTMSNGVEIPALGLGTWQIDDATAERVVREALEVGYRHIDTAQLYANEEGVGRGLRAAGVPREEVFLTTKVADRTKTYDEAKASIEGSLRKLGTDYIDLQLGCCVLPKTTHRKWMEQNLALDFVITDEDMAWLCGIGRYEGWKGADSE